jgi:CcmD family protein
MMTMIKRLTWGVCSMLAFTAPVFALQPPAEPGGFVPMNSLPPAEQLPAAPLLIAAYAFVWIALMVYLWSIWSRLGRVEREMQALQQRLGRGSTR